MFFCRTQLHFSGQLGEYKLLADSLQCPIYCCSVAGVLCSQSVCLNGEVYCQVTAWEGRRRWGGGRRWAAVRHLAAYFSSESMRFVNVHFAVSINFLLEHYRNGVTDLKETLDVQFYHNIMQRKEKLFIFIPTYVITYKLFYQCIKEVITD